jgi:hypothetical protein
MCVVVEEPMELPVSLNLPSLRGTLAVILIEKVTSGGWHNADLQPILGLDGRIWCGS